MPIILGLAIYRTSVPLPFQDEWEWAQQIYDMHRGALTFAQLWAQHNEHRVIFPNLITLGLDRLGGWNPTREQYLGVVLLIITQVGLIRLFVRSARWPLSAVASVAGSILLYGFWQWENFAAGVDFVWFICNAAAIWLLVLLSAPHRRWPHLLGAAALSVVATYSEAQGLLCWFMGAIVIVLIPRKLVPTLSVWLIATAAAYFGYVHGLVHVPNDNFHVSVLRQPLLVFHYWAVYFGVPLMGWKGLQSSEIVGLIGVGLFILSFIIDVCSHYRLRRMVLTAPWYALGALPFATGFGTAAGRAGFGLDQALAPRYTTVSTLIWIALIGLLVTRGSAANRLLQAARTRTLASFFSGAAACLFVLALTMSELHGIYWWKVRHQMMLSVRDGLLQSDPSKLDLIYPSRDRVLMLLNEVRRLDDGPFIRQH
jgi:hypothetical protein